jgi:hypothetical protein
MAALRLPSSHTMDGVGERLLHAEKVLAITSEMSIISPTPDCGERPAIARI